MGRDREMPPILLLSRLKGSQLAAQMPHAKEEAVLGAKTFPGHTVMAAEQGELPCPLRDMVTGRHLARLRLLGGGHPCIPPPCCTGNTNEWSSFSHIRKAENRPGRRDCGKRRGMEKMNWGWVSITEGIQMYVHSVYFLKNKKRSECGKMLTCVETSNGLYHSLIFKRRENGESIALRYVF